MSALGRKQNLTAIYFVFNNAVAIRFPTIYSTRRPSLFPARSLAVRFAAPFRPCAVAGCRAHRLVFGCCLPERQFALVALLFVLVSLWAFFFNAERAQ